VVTENRIDTADLKLSIEYIDGISAKQLKIYGSEELVPQFFQANRGRKASLAP
jgi:hypothetical protein